MYNLDWLSEKAGQNTTLQYHYFWEHTPKQPPAVDQSCLSQWFDSPFQVSGRQYATAEHWMLAHKALLFKDTAACKQILAATDPTTAKSLGRTVSGFVPEIWEETAYELVIAGNIHKFNQHPELAAHLLGTGDAILVEASPSDTIWGVGLSQDNNDIQQVAKWRGTNLLGFALMETRDFLRDFGHFDPVNLPTGIQMPWEAYPEIAAVDNFWHIGEGEELIGRIAAFYSELSDREQVVFQLSHPPIGEWGDFYADEDDEMGSGLA